MKLPKPLTDAIRDATALEERRRKLEAAIAEQQKIVANAKAAMRTAEAELADAEAAALVGEGDARAVEAARRRYDEAHQGHARAPAVLDGLKARHAECLASAAEIEDRLGKSLHAVADAEIERLRPRFEEAAATIREVRDVLQMLGHRTGHGTADYTARQWSLTDLEGKHNLLLDFAFVKDGDAKGERMPAWRQTEAAVALHDAISEAADLKRRLKSVARRAERNVVPMPSHGEAA